MNQSLGVRRSVLRALGQRLSQRHSSDCVLPGVVQSHAETRPAKRNSINSTTPQHTRLKRRAGENNVAESRPSENQA